MKDRIEEIKIRIDEIIIDLLVPIRASKTVDQKAFDEFYLILDEVVSLVKGKEEINRELAGLIFFIYTSIEADANHARVDYNHPLFRAVAKVQSYLIEILQGSPFKK